MVLMTISKRIQSGFCYSSGAEIGIDCEVAPKSRLLELRLVPCVFVCACRKKQNPCRW